MHVEAARKHCLSAVCYGIIFIPQSHYKTISERSSQVKHNTAQYIPASKQDWY
jgi:hypothetical protein